MPGPPDGTLWALLCRHVRTGDRASQPMSQSTYHKPLSSPLHSGLRLKEGACLLGGCLAPAGSLCQAPRAVQTGLPLHLCGALSPRGAKLAKDTLGVPSESDGSPVPACPPGTLLPHAQAGDSSLSVHTGTVDMDMDLTAAI